jgi:hypothetical protein
MGIRPNRHAPERGCRHAFPPVPVEVHDRLDGRPEVVAWLCPLCYEKTHAPPPPPPVMALSQLKPDLDIIEHDYLKRSR